MPSVRRPKLLFLFLSGMIFSLTACGAGNTVAPTLLVIQNVNGPYLFTANGNPAADPVLFNGVFASSDPKAESGTDYYSPVTGTLTSNTAITTGSCGPTTFQLSGKITNPNVNDVDIDMTGTAPGGTITLSGVVGKQVPNGDLGSLLTLKVAITGTCALSSTTIIGTR